MSATHWFPALVALVASGEQVHLQALGTLAAGAARHENRPADLGA